MNPNLTDAPRNALTQADVLAILTTSPSISYAAGAELLNTDLSVAKDLSPWLTATGSSVSSSVSATIHRTCNLVLDLTAPLPVEPLVRPYVVMTDNDSGVAARFNLGAFLLSSPSPDNTFYPSQGTFEGYDLLQTLNQPLGDSIEVSAGSDMVAAAAGIIGEAWAPAQVNYTYPASGTPTAEQAYSWSTSDASGSGSVTYLQVVNALLLAAGYLPVWVDWNGFFTLTPYSSPADTTPMWTFDFTNSQTNLEESRSATLDLFDVPNWWRFTMSNPTNGVLVEGSSQFTYEDDISSTGVGNRGRTVRKVVSLDAVDFQSLVKAAVQQIELDLLPAEQYNLTSFPLPLLWHRDVVKYVDPNTADNQTTEASGTTSRLCMVDQWTLSLDANDDETLVLQTITPVIDNILTSQGIG